MKTMKLPPLKIAVTSAMIVGLGAVSTANAQAVETAVTDIGESNLEKMIFGDTFFVEDQGNFSMKFYSDSDKTRPSSMLFDQILTNQMLNGFKEGQPIIPVDQNGKIISREDTLVEKGVSKNVRSVTTKIATADDVANSPYSRGIQGDIDDLYNANAENVERIVEIDNTVFVNRLNIKELERKQENDIKEVVEMQSSIAEQADKNQNDIQTLENNVEEELLNLSGRLLDQKADIANNINNIYELAQQQDQHSSDIKTLKKNVEEGLLELSGHLIDQKADIAQNQTDIQDLATYNELQDQYAQKQTEAIDALNKASSENTQNIEDLAAYNELQDAYAKQQTEAIDALNKASSENTQNIQDLAAYNELQDQYAQKQTEAIDALNKASSENTQNIEDLAAYNELQDAYAKQQTEAIDALNKASSENTQNIAKNQADIANNINNIYELAQQQDQHSSDIKTLAKVSAANADRIAKNKADADASFETLTKNQNTLIEKDKEHDKLITANKTAIDANKASADTKFAATADAITKNGNAITKNAKSITDLGTKVDGFDSRVTALDTKVNAFDGRITALDSKVENGMAAQAALSGLFQPYSVGKFNATAALGGYGSKSAVAIGAGYRVNPNLAFKAGAAINTSGNKKGSYNIGVNYEF